MTTMSTTMLVLHGPNLNLLGTRRPELYGAHTLEEINGRIREAAAFHGFDVLIEQRNGEGELVDLLHHHAVGCADSPGKAAGVVINPGAYAHYGLALRDALEAVTVPTVEVHLTNIHGRDEAFRHQSVTAAVCTGFVAGFGWRSYVVAIHAMKTLLGG